MALLDFSTRALSYWTECMADAKGSTLQIHLVLTVLTQLPIVLKKHIHAY